MLHRSSHSALIPNLPGSNESPLIVKKQWSTHGLTVHCTDAGSAGIFICISVMAPSAATRPKLSRTVSTAHQLYEIVAAILMDKAAVLVHERVFASLACAEELTIARRQVFAAYGLDHDTPVSLIQGDPAQGEGIAGILLQAIPLRVAQVDTLRINNTAVGRRWSTTTAEYLVLQLDGITGQRPSARAKGLDIQADSLFTMAATLLAERHFAFSDVARTWFYIRDILQHYASFNAMRDSHYARYGLMPKPPAPICLPASTAIKGTPASGAALIGDILAVKPANKIPAQRLSNPGQKEAFSYGASFARATRLYEQDVSIIQVSGTAAIDEAGATLFRDDAAAQISCTLDKLEALLATTSAQLTQVVTANVFVKDPSFVTQFHAIAKQRGLSDFPGIAVVADVCRDDLLFEIDAEVAVPAAALVTPIQEVPTTLAGGNAQ